jgi:glycosyltransferase involved in cell wall biosynthesis
MIFRVIVVGGPCGPWIGRCLSSLSEQTDKEWTCGVVLDKCDDAADKAVQIASADNRFQVAVNMEHRRALPNIIRSISMQGPAQEDVLVTLDADDWLNGPDVLSKVRAAYAAQPNLLITYGSWVGHPDPTAVNNSNPYQRHEFTDGSLRRGPWRGSHLRTFKHKLWSLVKDEDLRDRNGKFYECAWDLAFMWPMLEMAGHDRSKWFPDRLYVYNRETLHNDEKLRSPEQYRNHQEIMSKKPYTRAFEGL